MVKYDNKNQKNKKIMIGFILFLMMLFVTYVGYSYYKNNRANLVLREEILETIKNNDVAFFLENELQERIWQRMEKESFESSSNLALSTNMKNNMFSELDLSKFELEHKWIRDNHNLRNYHCFTTKYAGNDLFNLDFLGTQTQVALQSGEIVNKYVGVEKKNVQNVVNQIKQEEVDLSDFKKIKNFIIDRQPIQLSNLAKASLWDSYASFIEKQIVNQNITKKENVVITMDSEQIPVTEYAISFKKEQVKPLVERNFTDINER